MGVPVRRTWTLGGSVAGLAIVAIDSVGVGAAEASPAGARHRPDCSALCAAAQVQQQAADGGSVTRRCSAAGSAGPSSGYHGVVRAAPGSYRRWSRPRAGRGRHRRAFIVVRSASPPAPRTRRPPARTPGLDTQGSPARRPATPVPAAAPVVGVAAPVAAAPDYGTMLSSSYARVPASLLGTAAPAGGAGASLIAPAGYDPGLLLSAPLGRTLAPAAAADGVTTTSDTGPILMPDLGSRLGTPLLLGVLATSTVIALAVRSAVLRRSRLRPA